ncbi:indoleamine -dioxygenase, partial [Colletotrichum incanum]
PQSLNNVISSSFIGNLPIKPSVSVTRSLEIQTRINKLPTLGTKGLHGKAEWRRAYVILCFLAHGYIWASNPPAEVLPPTITLPLLAISDFLEVPPVATYAALTLSSKTDKVQLEGLTVEHTFTGTDDKAWFYLVSVAMEAQGGRIISVATSALSHILERDYTAAIALLHSLAAKINNLSNILGRLHENCNPNVFFYKIRPFLQGGQESAGFFNRIFYDKGSGKGSWRQLKGGSNGQSSLFHFLNIVLGVQYVLIQTKASKDFRDKASKCFFREMREYIPRSHRRFLSLFSDLPNLRDLEAYRQATRSLTRLRTKYLSIVARYIILPLRPTSQQPNNQEELYGTGATLLIPFLKQARDKTNQAGESQP